MNPIDLTPEEAFHVLAVLHGQILRDRADATNPSYADATRARCSHAVTVLQNVAEKLEAALKLKQPAA